MWTCDTFFILKSSRRRYLDSSLLGENSEVISILTNAFYSQFLVFFFWPVFHRQDNYLWWSWIHMAADNDGTSVCMWAEKKYTRTWGLCVDDICALDWTAKQWKQSTLCMYIMPVMWHIASISRLRNMCFFSWVGLCSFCTLWNCHHFHVPTKKKPKRSLLWFFHAFSDMCSRASSRQTETGEDTGSRQQC